MELFWDSDEPEEVTISNKMDSAKKAVNDMVEINPKTGGRETMGIYLFATSEEEAIANAILRRNMETEI